MFRNNEETGSVCTWLLQNEKVIKRDREKELKLFSIWKRCAAVSLERASASSETAHMKCKTILGKFTTVRTAKLCGLIKEDSRENILETVIADHISYRKEGDRGK